MYGLGSWDGVIGVACRFGSLYFECVALSYDSLLCAGVFGRFVPSVYDTLDYNANDAADPTSLLVPLASGWPFISCGDSPVGSLPT